jgi:hypothetical protein
MRGHRERSGEQPFAVEQDPAGRAEVMASEPPDTGE